FLPFYLQTISQTGKSGQTLNVVKILSHADSLLTIDSFIPPQKIKCCINTLSEKEQVSMQHIKIQLLLFS
ncbi:hypothetical protein EZS27_033394, partial [termite gut metagenome]